MNKVIFMGRLTADPDYRKLQSGIAVCNFTIAIDRPQKKDKPKETDFINCQAWRSTADLINKYFKKGRPIIVEGSMRNNNYTDKNGVQRYEMLALVDSVCFTLSDGSQKQQAQPQQQQYAPPQANYQQSSQQYQQPPAPPVYQQPIQQYAQAPQQQPVANGQQAPF